MSIILNEVIISRRIRSINSKNLYSKVIEILQDKKSLTFPEIVKELNLENGERIILIDVLRKLESEGKIKSIKTQITTNGGISLTSRFFL